MKKLFQHSETNHFHISVGALLVKDGKVLVHRVPREKMPEKYHHLLGGLEQVYMLMRESLENDESLEGAVLRGIKEEFGAVGAIQRYLGSIQAKLHDAGGFEKTTLYFEVLCTSLGERPSDDEESFTLLEWHDPKELLELMRSQVKHTDRADLDETKILETYLAQS